MNVTLNGESKGEYFVVRDEGGNFLVRARDLGAMGLKIDGGTGAEIEGETYRSLRSLEGVAFEFDDMTLSLAITTSPAMLPGTTIDFAAPRQPRVSFPADNSAFANYGLGYSLGKNLEFSALDASAEIGVRRGQYLFLSNFSYAKTRTDETFARLLTNVTRDRRDTLQRTVYGDVVASSGDLGSTVNIGGVGFSKEYPIDPYFIKYPRAGISGVLSAPSEVDVYVNGLRVRTEKLPPGPYELKNLYSYGGASAVTLIARDPFGREQTIRYPFYFTDAVLRKGLQEYSYNAGWLRDELGIRSFRYGNPAASAFHRFGLTDALTVGGRAEGGDGRYNAGPQLSWLASGAGILSASASLSIRDGGAAGGAVSLSHTYQDNVYSARALLRWFSGEYGAVGSESLSDRTRSLAAAGFGYGTKRTGSISVDGEIATKYAGTDRQVVTAAYTRKLPGDVTLLLSLKRGREGDAASTEFFLGATYYPWSTTSISAGCRRAGDANTETVEVQKSAPLGEGYGFRTTAERTDSAAESKTTLNPFVQYNARRGIYTAEYKGEFGNRESGGQAWRLGASGAVAYAGEAVAFTRPIADSFGVVQVDGLENVRVYYNSQEMGRTDSAGRVVVPSLGSYIENQLSFNDKDVPINYTVPEVARFVSPPLRSGSLIRFDAKKLQAMTGTLRVRVDGQDKPVEFREIRMKTGDRESTFPTGRGGEFYVEDVRPGTYAAEFQYDNRTCTIDVTVPRSDEMMTDLGVLRCENIR